MSHNIEIINGQARMAYAGELPWHGLGVKVDSNLTPEQMLVAADLDWKVEKRPLFYFPNPDTLNDDEHISLNDRTIVPKKMALVRTSDEALLDVIGDDWNPLQNSEAFEFFADFVEEGGMEMHTAGALEGGRRVWALAKVNESFDAMPGDRIDQYLLFSNPHKYGMSIDVRMTPIRVVCNNTLTVALNIAARSMVKVNHRRLFDATVVKEMLGIAQEKLTIYKGAAKFLASKNYTQKTVKDYFTTVFPHHSLRAQNDNELSRNATTALTILETQPGADLAGGTWWNAFNTVTYMTDHMLGRTADTRLTSSWFGINKKKKDVALATAMQYAEAA